MLELAGLTKRYGDVVALDGLSMTVEPGRIHGFVGRNGAGKTTTMRITLGLARADAGEVRWKDRPATAEDRRGFGYMPEERGLYPKMTALDQIVYFARLSGMAETEATTAATTLLESIGLGDRAREPVERLSLGNQQRCQLAAALVTSPELLVLDEPFSGLDPVGVDALAAVLQRQVDEGTAVVFSSHQLDLVERLSDEVTIIDGGRVVASGPVAAVRRSRSVDQLKVALEGGWTAWAESLPGAKVVGRDGDEVVLELLPGADDQAVLDAARQAGRVRSFRREAPSLTELFREVVSS
ncbi:MAG: ATP-binding cassette domain-containing protein [Actinomycetota bacterium]|nr:ATP-binding cassette domain-containing protein [Actinomycetota bacterium]